MTAPIRYTLPEPDPVVQRPSSVERLQRELKSLQRVRDMLESQLADIQRQIQHYQDALADVTP